MPLIEATIEVPFCWAALLALPDFNNLPEFPQSEKTAHAIDDPAPFYDECRSVGLRLPDGAWFALDLVSGQSNYYLYYEISDARSCRASAVSHELEDGALLTDVPGYAVRVRLV